MKNNLEAALNKIFGSEGGFSNRSLKADPGGPTMWGVTQAKLSGWRGKKVSVDDVRKLTIHEAADIYRMDYARPVHFDELPSGVDYAMLDFAINSGPGQASKTLQRAVVSLGGDIGPTGVDGSLGTTTLLAVNSVNTIMLIDALMDHRWAFMQGLANFPQNKNGWRNRIREVRDYAKRLAKQLPPSNDLIKMVTLRADLPLIVDDNNEGADAKAYPAQTKITSTSTGQGITTAGAGIGVTAAAKALQEATTQLQPLVGTHAWIDYTFTGLTAVGALVGVVGIAGAFIAYKGRLASGGTI